MENTGWAQVSMSVPNRLANSTTEQVETAQGRVKIGDTLQTAEASKKEPVYEIALPV